MNYSNNTRLRRSKQNNEERRVASQLFFSVQVCSEADEHDGVAVDDHPHAMAGASFRSLGKSRALLPLLPSLLAI
jgi:hypothetical protein